MADPIKQDGSSVGFRYAEEDSFGVVSGDEVWTQLGINSYDSFGPTVTTVARQTINDTRQNELGAVSDLDAAASFETDYIQSANVIDLFQGFFFADFTEEGTTTPRNAAQIVITAVDDVPADDQYEAAAGLDGIGLIAEHLILAENFDDATNNGVKRVKVVAATAIDVYDTLLADGAPAATAGLSLVGYQFESATLDVTQPGGGVFPSLTRASGAVDFTTIGLSAGQWIWIGGDAADTSFDTAVNNGLARVVSVTATTITLDRTTGTMVAEVGADENIQIFFSDQLNNAVSAANIVRRTYQLERTLGADDTAAPTELQSEYLVGSVPNELTLNIPITNKVSLNWSFVAKDHETNTGDTGEKAGTRPTLGSFPAYGTSDDVTRIRINAVSTTDSNPGKLAAFVSELTINVNNNVVPNKAVTTLGAFEMSTGQFVVTGSLNAYFAKNDALDSIRASTSVGIDAFMVKNNAGLLLDVPLVTVGGGPASVELNAPITLPLTFEAVRDGNLSYTMSVTAFKYLPDAAAV